MRRTARTTPASAAATATRTGPAQAAGLPLNALGDFAALASEWQRLFTRAWSDLGRQAEVERTEITELQSPGQAWLLQLELTTAQASRMARFFEEALAASLDLQTRWFKQFESMGLSGLQAWLPAEGRAGGMPTGAFGAWADWQRQLLSALRHDVEGERTAA